MVIERPVPFDLMTLDEWIALPEDNSAHYELQEGVLIVAPKRGRRHLAQKINPQQLPPGWEALISFEVVVERGETPTVRVPDLVVVRVGAPEARIPAGEVDLVVEIISPGSRNVDTHLKAFEYAAAGIPHYWLVDLEGPAPSITVFGGDGYRAKRTANHELVVDTPFPLRIDIDALV
jgi:Uma2 family endonuclease